MKYFLALMAVLLLSACSHQHDEVVVGVVGPFSGPAAYIGEWGKEGVTMAAEQVEHDTGRKVRLIYEDDRCEAAPSLAAMNKLKEIDDAKVAVGVLCGSPTKAVAAWLPGDFLVVSSGDNFGRMHEDFYSTRFLIYEEGKTIADFAYTNLSLRRVGIIYYQNEWGETEKEEFARRFKERGGVVVGAEGFGLENDFRTALLKFKSADADGVFMVYNEVGDIVNQIAELRMNVTKLTDSQVENEQSVRVGGRNLEGIYYARPIGGSSPFAAQFREEYKKRYGHDPDVIAIDSYDAMLVLGKASTACDGDIACIREQIQATRDLPGANGPLTFNKDLWGFEKHFVIKTFRDGAFKTIS